MIEMKESGLVCLNVEQREAMVLEYLNRGSVLEIENNRFKGRKRPAQKSGCPAALLLRLKFIRCSLLNVMKYG